MRRGLRFPPHTAVSMCEHHLRLLCEARRKQKHYRLSVIRWKKRNGVSRAVGRGPNENAKLLSASGYSLHVKK